MTRTILALSLLSLLGCTGRRGHSKGGGQLIQNPDETGMCSVLGTVDPGERFSLDGDKDAPSLMLADGPAASVGNLPSYWDVGQTITVCFLGDSKGTEALKTKVFEIASEWGKVANVTLDRVDACTSASSSDIKVRLGDNVSGDTGSWSYIGQVSKTKYPSMNLGWAAQTNLSLKSLRRVVLHEFGHALGLQHEQLNPNVTIPWDKPKVYEYYKECCGWAQEDVDQNVFRTLDPASTQALLYDRFSIMHYMVPKTLLTNAAFEVKNNTELSNGDKLWAAIAYPRQTINRDLARKIYEAYLADAGQMPQYTWFQENKFPPTSDKDWSTRDEVYASAHPYANNSSTTKTFDVQDAQVKFVRARFNRVETEEAYDFLSFLQSDGTFLDRFSGTSENFLSPAVPGSKLQIQFTSDGSTTAFGFELKGLEYTTKEIHLLGCTRAGAPNYDATAKVEDGSCQSGSTDTTAPVPGALSFSNVTANGLSLSWTVGSDNATAADKLQYLFYYKKGAAPTRAEALANAAFTAGLTSQSLSSLEPGTTYHFLVLVKDEAGNIAEYSTQTTTTLPRAPASGDVATCSGEKLTVTQGSMTMTYKMQSAADCIAARDLFNKQAAAN